MRRLFTTLVIVLIITTSFHAQVQINAPGKFFIEKLKQLDDPNHPPKAFIQDYDLIHVNGLYHIGALGMVDSETIDEAHLDALGVINRSRAGDIWTFRVPLENVTAFVETQGLLMIEIAEPVSPYLHEALVSSRADSVHNGLGLINSYKGENVIVAVIDWGFDYTHPMFYDEDLQELRLSRAWDQNKIIGTPPDGYDFGAEYIGPELLVAKHDTDYVFGPGTHGTHVAGIAGGAGAGPDASFAVAGGGGAARFIGGAPKSELIFISLRRDAPSLIDGFNYIKDYAESVDKPFVVNMSFGSHLGPHDGNDLKNIGIDNLHGPGRIFVGSAGNNGTGNFHLEHDFNNIPDTMYTVVNIHTASDWGQNLSMWGSENSNFSASISTVTSGDEYVFSTPFFSSTDNDQIEEIYEFDNGELHIRVMTTESFTTNNKPNIRFEVRNTTPHKLVLRVASDDTHLHMWSNARMENRYTNWGSGLSNNFPNAISGNNDYAPGEPAGCGKNVITVGAYRAERIQSNGTVLYGAMANFSSRGPTVDGRVKPDISGPGVQVWSSINSYTTDGENPIEFEDQTYTFGQLSGTSMSGPMVAGVVALMLEADPTLTALNAREILRSTARLDNHTGEIGEGGDLQWGWGKANALAALSVIESIVGVEGLKIETDRLNIYPNPAVQAVTLELNSIAMSDVNVTIYDLSGKLRLSRQIMQGSRSIRLELNGLEAGMYLITAEYGNTLEVTKLLITE